MYHAQFRERFGAGRDLVEGCSWEENSRRSGHVGWHASTHCAGWVQRTSAVACTVETHLGLRWPATHRAWAYGAFVFQGSPAA
eukprot:1726493-Pleurochrysis_carterae.AAC.7